MSLRYEFVTFAFCHGSNMRELCCRFEISTKTGYKWISRCLQDGVYGLKDRLNRPHNPGRTADKLEQRVLTVRDTRHASGGRKLGRIHLELEFFCVSVPSKNVPASRKDSCVPVTNSQNYSPGFQEE